MILYLLTYSKIYLKTNIIKKKYEFYKSIFNINKWTLKKTRVLLNLNWLINFANNEKIAYF